MKSVRKFLLTASMFIAKHSWLYYLLNFTWGFIMTFIGMIVAAVMSIMYETYRFGYATCFQVGEFWGGVSLGMTFIRDTTSSNIISRHEYGHTFQNAILGPFMPFVVGIPSVIRYWYRYLKYERKGLTPPTEYDSVWFEASATEIGIMIIDSNK